MFYPRAVDVLGRDLFVQVVEHGQPEIPQERGGHTLAVECQWDFLRDVVMPFVAGLHDGDAHFIEHCGLAGQWLVQFDLGLAFHPPEESCGIGFLRLKPGLESGHGRTGRDAFAIDPGQNAGRRQELPGPGEGLFHLRLGHLHHAAD